MLLSVRALAGLVFLLAVIAAALFLTAGTMHYWQAALFLAVFGGSVMAITLYLAVNDRALLERRTQAGPAAEKERTQKIIQSLASVVFLGIFITSGFDHRFGWSDVPTPFVIVGDAAVALGLYIVFLTFRENTYTSAVIAVDSAQKVAASGPYAIVRHPMYAGALLMLAGVPVGLGSLWGLIALLPMVVVLVLRLLAEEQFLITHLAGYAEYRARVKRRLIPGLW